MQAAALSTPALSLKAKPRVDNKVMQAWQAATTLPLSRAEAICLDGFGPQMKRKIEVSGPNTFHVSLEWPADIAIETDGPKKATSDFCLNFNTRVLQDGNIYVPTPMRGAAIGPRFMAARLRLGRALRFARMDFQIAGDLGAYVWSRGHVTPNAATRGWLSGNLQNRLGALEPVISAKQYKEIDEATRLKRPDDLYRIANMRDVLGREGRNAFLGAMQGFDNYFNLDATELIKPDLTIGKFMLARQSFIASVPLDCPVYTETFIELLHPRRKLQSRPSMS